MSNRILATLAAAAVTIIAAPQAVSAQPAPSYAQPGVPSYASQDEQIHGRIISFDGGYHLEVRDERGYVDNVEMHPGTVINPTGLTLAPGMVVSITGYNAGPYFAANEIDTPYELYGAVPYYVGHPWYYYGPSVSLGFFFGNLGWWHGGYYAHPIRVYGGVRIYNRPQQLYRGGAWHGRDFVAPPAHGGYYAKRDQRDQRGPRGRGPHGRGDHH